MAPHKFKVVRKVYKDNQKTSVVKRKKILPSVNYISKKISFNTGKLWKLE